MSLILDLHISFKDEEGNTYIWEQGTHYRVVQPYKGGYFKQINKPTTEILKDIKTIKAVLKDSIK